MDSLTYDMTEWELYDSGELIEYDDNETYNPTTIGQTNTVDNIIITTGNYTKKPRDGPTINHENGKKKRINNINQYEETINNYHNTMVPNDATNDIM